MIDKDRVHRFVKWYRLNRAMGLRLLFEWTRTDVINRATFVVCAGYISCEGCEDCEDCEDSTDYGDCDGLSASLPG